MEVLEILRNARAVIEDPKHWIQGDYWDGEAGFCAVGAIRRAVAGRRGEHDARALLDEVVDGDIIAFNDLPEQKHECVIAAFDAAIEKEQNGDA